DWKSTEMEGALAVALADPNIRPTLDTWLGTAYRPGDSLSLLYENNLVGTLSADGRLVYMLDSLAVPAPPAYLAPHVWNSPQVPRNVRPLVKGNSLYAFEQDIGKIAFKLGGIDSTGRSDEFHESHFLGVPLSVGSRLYVLNEKNDGRLRLVCIEPRRFMDKDQIKWQAVVIPPIQELGTVAEGDRFWRQSVRGITAVHL